MYFYLYIILNIILLLKHQDSLSIYTYNITNSFTFNQCQWHGIKAKNQGVHKAAVVLRPGGHAKQRFAFWGLSEVIGLSIVDLVAVPAAEDTQHGTPQSSPMWEINYLRGCKHPMRVELNQKAR
jgi:hypothetical protein